MRLVNTATNDYYSGKEFQIYMYSIRFWFPMSVCTYTARPKDQKAKTMTSDRRQMMQDTMYILTLWI